MLQFITHRVGEFDEFAGTEAVVKGGCRWVQLRMKDSAAEEIIQAGKRIAEVCHSHGATFIIDDHVGLVVEIGADGVHLGKNDMPVSEARLLLGNKYIIGATANTFDDILAAVAAGADYIGLGPFRFTSTKKNLSQIIGLDGYRDIMSRCRIAGIKVPVVAIGGITSDDVAPLMSTGVSGVAVSGAILRATDPVAETSKIVEILKSSKI